MRVAAKRLRGGKACPPDHTPYGSQQLADNAATLHEWAAPACAGLDVFAHGDHWHIGHHCVADGDHCKATSPGRPLRDRERESLRARRRARESAST